ncbi:hypothetical protein GCK72_025267 [Caenorhabditis remanei]|uniref:SXP/RAL-2 family protein Ani s 5-like cation-binding domain-containing protein n=1 Tax=Caenorhabditis remanei TaxID=31234 RepID=A0A6A5G1F9_CAERE|nr:hypothetical protein GCK72_025267 [Caenorhabditis remanei]KAF1748800.1 hypothetical protein GCK72_025267 [Caenorhabditis remanei]
MSSFLLFFLLLVASASAGVLYFRNADGSFMMSSGLDNMSNENLATSNNGNSKDESRHFAGNVDHPMNVIHVTRFPGKNVNVVQDTVDDRIVHETIQLGDPDISVVEKALVKDVVRIIMKNDEYMILLNHPTFPEIVAMVRSMLREPIQEVIQHQLWSKVLAIREYYDNVFKPFNDPEAKATAMEFLNHLKKSSEDHKLAVTDTVELGKRVKELAFLLQEEEFDQKLSELEGTLDDSKHEYKRSHHVRKNAVDVEPKFAKFPPPTVLPPTTLATPRFHDFGMMEMNNDNSNGVMKPVVRKMNNGDANETMNQKFNNVENENMKNGNMNGSTRKFSKRSSEEIPEYPRIRGRMPPVVRKMNNGDVDEPRYRVENNDSSEVEMKINGILDGILEPKLNITNNKKSKNGNAGTNKDNASGMKVENLNSTVKVSKSSSVEMLPTTSAPRRNAFELTETSNDNSGGVMKPVLNQMNGDAINPKFNNMENGSSENL